MKIGVDLDGVVYDFTGSFITYMRDNLGYTGPLPYPDRWNTWECWDMPMDDWLTYFRDGVAAGVIFRCGEPITGAVRALRKLKKLGHTIHIVTHRDNHPRAIQSTWEWLSQHAVPYDTLTFAKDKRVIPVDFFIEDNVDNYNALRSEGVDTVLFDQPWNRFATEAERVHNWSRFVDHIEEKALVAA